MGCDGPVVALAQFVATPPLCLFRPRHDLSLVTSRVSLGVTRSNGFLRTDPMLRIRQLVPRQPSDIVQTKLGLDKTPFEG